MFNSLVPDQARRFVGHDLDPKCLKRISAEIHRYFLFDHIAHTDALAVHRSKNRRVPNG